MVIGFKETCLPLLTAASHWKWSYLLLFLLSVCVSYTLTGPFVYTGISLCVVLSAGSSLWDKTQELPAAQLPECVSLKHMSLP